MARQQVVAARGDVDNQAPTVYRGKLEELMGTFRIIEANFIELYAGAGGSGSGAGNVLVSSTPGSGSITGYAPGIDLTVGRLDVSAHASNTTLNDMTAGAYDGQRVRIRNTGSTGILTLTNENAGSTAANRFSGAGDVAIYPGDCVDVVYYAGSVNRWVM